MIDITKLPESFRNFGLVTLQLPFWYIAIYIFNRPLYETKDFLLIGSVCIGLTLISFLISGFIYELGASEEKENKSKEFSSEFTLYESITPLVISTTLLAILIFIGYLCIKLFDRRLYWYSFLLIYFGIIMLMLFLLILGSKETKRNE